jgi:hypothetical protein
VTENMFVNCRKVDEVGTIVYITKTMEQYDIFKVEFHRYGPKDDALLGYKTFVPGSKEYLKKYEGKDSVKLKLLTKETQTSSSDFELNTAAFPPKDYIIDIYCNYHEKDHCNFYVVIKGYKRTGKNSFGDDLFDNGVELTPRSVSFRNWDFTTK